jgi:hypothetical protein
MTSNDLPIAEALIKVERFLVLFLKFKPVFDAKGMANQPFQRRHMVLF